MRTFPTHAADCWNCKGDGWVYEMDETIPFHRHPDLDLGPGVLCPVCMGGITYAEPATEAERLAQRHLPNTAPVV